MFTDDQIDYKRAESHEGIQSPMNATMPIQAELKILVDAMRENTIQTTKTNELLQLQLDTLRESKEESVKTNELLQKQIADPNPARIVYREPNDY